MASNKEPGLLSRIHLLGLWANSSRLTHQIAYFHYLYFKNNQQNGKTSITLKRYKSAKLYISTALYIPPTIGESMLLSCMEVSKRFGGLQALKNVDLMVKQGEIAGLVGPNGSGKSTLLNLISGVYKPDSGKITFLNEDITKLAHTLFAVKA
jgi:ABC-type multidrug transport system fused ATPase/permease subunit